jgi:hypothetical protein
MREKVRLSTAPFNVIVVGFAGLTSVACIDLSSDAGPHQIQSSPPAPPLPCAAVASPTPFCSSEQGTCPLLADDTVSCLSGTNATQAFSSTGGLGLASVPGNRGDMVFSVSNGADEQQQNYIEFGAFEPTGSATFSVHSFPPVTTEATGGQSNAGLMVVANPQGAPIILSTTGGGLSAAIGSATSGGTFTVEPAMVAPPNEEGWLIGGAAVDGSGVVDVLLQTGTTSDLAQRGTTGKWTALPLPALGFGSAALAVDTTGLVYVAGWVAAAAAGMENLEIIAGSKAPVVVASLAQTDVTVTQLTVGQDSDGSPMPVAAFGNPVTLAVPDGTGGFTTVQPTFAVAAPYQDGCGSSLSLGNCSCPQSCSQMGDTSAWVQLVRDAQGDVYVAWLEVNINMTYPVTLNSTSVGSQMITCSCSPDLQNGTGTTTGVGIQLERLVMSPSPSTVHRGTIPVPSDIIGSLQAVDGNGTVQLLVPSAAQEMGPVRRVVFDASQLP